MDREDIARISISNDSSFLRVHDESQTLWKENAVSHRRRVGLYSTLLGNRHELRSSGRIAQRVPSHSFIGIARTITVNSAYIKCTYAR